MKMPADAQVWVAPSDFHGVCAAGLTKHEAGSRERPLTMRMLDGEIGLLIPTQIIRREFHLRGHPAVVVCAAGTFA